MSASLGGESPPTVSFCGPPYLPDSVPPLPLGSCHYRALLKSNPARQNAPAVLQPPHAGFAAMVPGGGIFAPRTTCSDGPFGSNLIQIRLQMVHRFEVGSMEIAACRLGRPEES